MLENNTAFEWLIHIMELSVVLGIIAVTWYVRKHSSQSRSTEKQEKWRGD